MTFLLKADIREAGTPEMTRAQGLVPCVMYGPQIKPVSIAIDYVTFEKLYRKAGESSLVDLSVGEAAPVKVLIQEVQHEPVKGRVTHVDFRQINMNKELETTIVLEFVGESLAVKGLGGTLIKALEELNIKCLPKDLVGSIVIDISKLNTFSDIIRISDLSLPAGIVSMDNLETVIAKVSAPLTEDELKALEEVGAPVDLSKIEASEKKGKEAEEGEEGKDGEVAAGAKKDEKKEEKKADKK